MTAPEHEDTNEVTLSADAEQTLAAAMNDAAARGLIPTARFLFTPDNWFHFEEAVEACTRRGVELELAVADADGAAPVTALDFEQLRLLRDGVGQTWKRFEPGAQIRALRDEAFRELDVALRDAMWTRAEDDAPATASLRLPPPNAAWNTDPARRVDWWKVLFSRSHLPLIGKWLVELLHDHLELLASADGAWLRALVHRAAHEQHLPELLSWLRTSYGPLQQRRALVDQDHRFAAEFGLDDFGGPWIEKLGIADTTGRVAPFELGPASEPSAAAATVTVLIPSYKHQDYIADTVKSVLAQRHRALAVMVVDDRSPDETVANAHAIGDDRVHVRVNERNLGLGNSVLNALNDVETPYVALLNSDDLLHPDHLARCLEVLEGDPDAQLVTTGIALIDSDGGEVHADNASRVFDGREIYEWVHWFEGARPHGAVPQNELFPALLERNFLVTSSNIVARTDWLKSQAEALRSLKYCLDWQLFLQAALEGGLRHLQAPLIAYRLHATNTVWFREGRRWAYYLEVNRVAAAAIQSYLAAGPGDAKERFRAVIAAAAERLTINSEIDGVALFLNAILDRVQLDAAAAEDADVQTFIERLNEHAASANASQTNDDDAQGAAAVETNDAVLGKLAREENAELARRVESLMTRLDRATKERETSDEQKRTLYEDQKRRIEQADEQERRITKLYEDQQLRIKRADEQERRIAELFEDQKLRIKRADEQEHRVAELFEDQQLRIKRAGEQEHRIDKLFEDQRLRIKRAQDLEQRVKDAHQTRDNQRTLREQAESRLAEARSALEAAERRLNQASARSQDLERARDDVKQRLEARKRDLHRANQSLASTQQELKQAQGELKQAQGELEQAQGELERTREELAQETAQVASLHEAKSLMSKKVRELQQELERLLHTNEFRLGNFLWNKLPLGRISRMSKKWYQRLFNLKARAKMKRRSSKQHDGTAVVAACWQWPIYSHTFVYQEMVSLRQTGLDVQLFHWDLGSTDQLHKAFQYLYDNRTQLQPEWSTHKKDKEHFERTRPGRLRSFLERISPLCGKSIEELEKAPIVMQACSFARMAELANARYLHSYFFYDQSFMAMLAAWLLELPRGVSCYADHMMDDYEFKFVPLHIELADVVIATSARIKRELSELSGGKYDDKIVVKPNGVDGERFPPRERPPRSADEPFEVLSVSRIEPKKGLTHLVEAMAELKKRGHTVIAHIIGSEDPNSAGSVEYAQMFKRCIAEHDLQDQVILHGMMKQEEMPPIIEKCRAFVAPYVETESGDKDGIPTAMLEALASSLPIITTNSGSIVEVVDDGVEGIVVAQRDSMAYAEALAKVIADPKLEQQMAAAARARFDRDFDIQVTEKRLHERIHGFLEAKE